MKFALSQLSVGLSAMDLYTLGPDKPSHGRLFLHLLWKSIIFRILAKVRVGCLFLALANCGLAKDVAGVLNYQGRITSGSKVFNGTGQFKFALINSNATTFYWMNSVAGEGGPSNPQPSVAVSVTVSRGLYTVNLGDSSMPNMALLPASLFSDGIKSLVSNPLYLRVWFSDGTNGFEQLTPDQRLTAVGFALAAGYAQQAASVSDGSVGVAQLAPNTLDGSNLTGAIPLALLPTSVALKEPDLSRLSNALTAQFTSQLTLLSNQLQAGAAGLSGLTTVSMDPADSRLGALGFVPFYSLPGSNWVNGSDGGPQPRTGQGAAWTGQKWVVWGGSLGTTLSGAGGVYSPGLDAWQAIPPQDTLTPRTGCSLVWDGLEALAWGGISANGAEKSGARLNLGTGSWTAMVDSGFLAARFGHAAVWTGKRLVIWGGQNSATFFPDGALYDPLVDAWLSLPTVGAPTPRSGSAAVWAGDRLIIWGGFGPSGALGSGGQLVFGTNSYPTGWLGTSSTGAPLARVGQTAVWTGQKMLVWGGLTNGVPAGDGGAYDPVTDQWSALSVSNAPAGRSGHAALWTGQEMIIVGGDAGGTALASGSAYNPATDRWRPLTTSGDPVARTGLSAAWTGMEILTFGGQSRLTPLAALQRLNPQSGWYFYRKP